MIGQDPGTRPTRYTRATPLAAMPADMHSRVASEKAQAQLECGAVWGGGGDCQALCPTYLRAGPNQAVRGRRSSLVLPTRLFHLAQAPPRYRRYWLRRQARSPPHAGLAFYLPANRTFLFQEARHTTAAVVDRP